MACTSGKKQDAVQQSVRHTWGAFPRHVGSINQAYPCFNITAGIKALIVLTEHFLDRLSIQAWDAVGRTRGHTWRTFPTHSGAIRGASDCTIMPVYSSRLGSRPSPFVGVQGVQEQCAFAWIRGHTWGASPMHSGSNWQRTAFVIMHACAFRLRGNPLHGQGLCQRGGAHLTYCDAG